jgi:N-acetylated-alpha-linked acidic dipeptidase
MAMQVRPGDPLSPGLALETAQTLTPIPVLPLSSGDAEPLLRALGGPVAPAAWRGALPLTYHVGSGAAKARLRVSSNWDRKTLYDVIARIPGAVEPDLWIIRGNHHDAWVKGAADPVSGVAALLEEARALGELRRQGWRPRRTILYCLWDGEEPGLLGSTEWVQAHADELRRAGAVYLNSDGNGRGFLEAGGSPSLERLVNEVARDVRDPETGFSVGQRLRLAELAKAGPERQRELRSRPDLRIGALGSGSDYTAFLDHAGVASLDLGFTGEGLEEGQYHSAYDDFGWYTRFGDSEFVYGRALAQTAGTLVLRLADAELLPFRFGNLAETVKGYLGELVRLAADQREAVTARNRLIDEGAFAALADPRETLIPPGREAVPPHLDLAPLETAADRLAAAAEALDQAMAVPRAGVPAGVNAALAACERRLLGPAGLPGRPWFRHVVYAPGLTTGYGVKTFPGVREAIERKQWQEAEAQAVRAAGALNGVADLLTELAPKLAG